MTADVNCLQEKLRFGYCLIGITMLMFSTPKVTGQCLLVELTELAMADQEEFGHDVDVEGNTALISAWLDHAQGMKSGSAFIYRQMGVNWIEEQKLLASDGEAEDRFGSSVALNGNLAFVGARDDTHLGIRSGSMYIFEYDGSSWNEIDKLVPFDGGDLDRFGLSVAIDNDVLVVGSALNSNVVPNAGAAYVYRKINSAWVFAAKLTASDAEPFDIFGWSVDIDGDVIVVGAKDSADNSIGAVYVFRFDGLVWNEETKLTPSDGNGSELFGISVAISEEHVIVGASGESANGNNSGAAYAYQYDGSAWGSEQKIISSQGGWNRHFGRTVDIVGFKTIIGNNPHFAQLKASIYQFNGSDWVWSHNIHPGGTTGSIEAASLAMSPSTILLGTKGKAYLFSVNGNPVHDCNNNFLEDFCDITDGISDDCNNNGIPDECELDCNNNGIPNDCEIANSIGEQSPSLSPVQFGNSLEFRITNAQIATSENVVIRITITADLDNISEYINVQINGLPVGTLFVNDGLPCIEQTSTITFPVSAFNQILAAAGPDLVVKLIPSLPVTADACSSTSTATIRIEYQTQTDTNTNLIPDECESVGDVNGDAVVNTDDLLLLLGRWGDCPAAPDACMGDTNFDGAVDILDLLTVLGNWS